MDVPKSVLINGGANAYVLPKVISAFLKAVERSRAWSTTKAKNQAGAKR